jgi:RNA polymerase sigma-70 factor, ECF subfamily
MSDAFTRLYRDHVAGVYGYLAYRLGSRREAEALTEATFEWAFGRRTSFGSDRKENDVRLLRIAREVARDQLRESEPGGDPGFEAELDGALGRLERQERSVLALRYGGGLRAPEIARVLGMSQDRVRRAQSRGLRRLRTELERPPRRETGGSASASAGDHQESDTEQGEPEDEEGHASEPPG